MRDEFRTGVRGSGTVQQCCEDLGGVQVGGVRHGSGVVAVVPVLDDRVKEVGEHLRGAADTLGAGFGLSIEEVKRRMVSLGRRDYFRFVCPESKKQLLFSI